jgi:L-malate glycosyltransferase
LREHPTFLTGVTDKVGVNQRIKVALVAPSLRILGGQAVQADRLVSAWRNDPDVDAWLVPVNPVAPLPFRWLLRMKYVRTLVTELTYVPLLIRELARADVVHVFSASYASFLLAPLPAVLIGRAFGRPIILNYRSGEASDHLRRSSIARRTLGRVNSNIVPSSFLVDVFHEFGVHASVIPNLVDFDRFRFKPRGRLRPRLVSTRNFDALYNVACTIRAFRLVQDRWPDASLTLVGGGAQDGMLRQLVARLALKNVVFVGRIPPDKIAEYYAANDIYIQSPNIDNMPTSVIEACASGLPVVSTAAGGVPAILTAGEDGLLAPLDDHETLAAHALQLLDDSALAQRLADAAYARCRACTWPSVRGLWLAAYRDVLTRAEQSRSVSDKQEHAPGRPASLAKDSLRPPLPGRAAAANQSAGSGSMASPSPRGSAPTS